MPKFDDTPEGRYESDMYYGQWTDSDIIRNLVYKDEEITTLQVKLEQAEREI